MVKKMAKKHAERTLKQKKDREEEKEIIYVEESEHLTFLSGALLDILNKNIKAKKRTIVFCNTLASCRSTDHFLTESGVKTSNYHGGVPPMVKSLF